MRRTRTCFISATALAQALLLAACGGAEPVIGERPQARPASPSGVALPWGLDRPVLHARASAEPADPAARTRHGRYLSSAQAGQMLESLGEMAIAVRVEPGPDAGAAIDLALESVWGHQAAHHLPVDAPVLVSGPDLRLAAATVHRLEAAGYARVLLVTP